MGSMTVLNAAARASDPTSLAGVPRFGLATPGLPPLWSYMRLMRVAWLRSGESITSEEIDDNGEYPVFGGNGLRGFTAAYTHDGDFPLVGRQGALCGCVNFASGRFWASEHAVVAAPLDGHNSKYLFYVLGSMSLGQHSQSAAQPGLSVDVLRTLEVPVPPSEDQLAIADFLDRETERIDALVAKKQRLIELLREKRTALVGHATTKGLDPDVPMKDSGIEWLGEVPRLWQVMRLSRITTRRCDGPFGSGLKSDHYVDAGRRVVRLQNIGSGRFDYRDRAFVDEGYYQEHLGDHDVLPEDVLIAGLGDEAHPVGRACVAPHDLGDAMVKADCFRFRIDLSKADPRFLALHLTATAPAISVVLGTGATRSRVNMSTMATREIALPPLSEQQAIASCVEIAERRINYLTQAVAEAIERLQEFRSALITAAVTGQIDARICRSEAS
jgi:type I restriction enzyme S subunit